MVVELVSVSQVEIGKDVHAEKNGMLSYHVGCQKCVCWSLDVGLTRFSVQFAFLGWTIINSGENLSYISSTFIMVA